MRKIAHSLYWRISAALMALLLFLGMAYIIITGFAAKEYYEETSQRLNADVAEHLIKEIKPFVNGEVNNEGLGVLMHSMMAVNPSIEVYLLDTNGLIKSFVVFDKKVKLKSVDLAPIHAFLQNHEERIIVGDNPRIPGKSTIFSAAEVRENNQLQGYVYIILASEQYENITETLLNSYLLRLSTAGFFLTLLATMHIGLWLLWLLTKNLREIVHVLGEFKDGNLEVRIEKDFKGEMAVLSTTFNGMADTIVQNIEDLKQVDHLRRELIANVSHDLRTPIAIISGYIETLNMKQGQLSEEQQAKYLRTILNSTEKLKRLISDLFELSKLEARQVSLKQERFQLSEVLADTCQQYQSLAQEKQIELEVSLTDTPMVLADLALIERVIQNLMDNALKYTPEQGKVAISIATNNNNQVAVSISNTGQGIAQDKIHHIFNRYYKGAAKGSTGLGLAIVKNILDIHQATIEVTSIEHQYTNFQFTLPVG